MPATEATSSTPSLSDPGLKDMPNRQLKNGAIAVQQRIIVSSGRLLKMARIFDEPWLDLPPLEYPEAVVEILRDHGTSSDVFTFAQALPETTPLFSGYHLEWDNIAAAPASDFKAWWEGLPQESRKNVRRSQKRGIAVRAVTFDDQLIAGIKAIYDETPFRQGRRFWHYGKPVEIVKRENSSYLHRSHFIGAFLDSTLVGFIKMVQVGSTARVMQILSMNAHFDKNVTNALITAAMEFCSQRAVEHFIYGQYVYGNKHNSSVTEFKRRNGFLQILLPRYYLPITAKGRVALSMGLHRGAGGLLPEPIINFLLDSRSFVYEKLAPSAR